MWSGRHFRRLEGNIPRTAPGEPLPCLQQTVFSGSACRSLTNRLSQTTGSAQAPCCKQNFVLGIGEKTALNYRNPNGVVVWSFVLSKTSYNPSNAKGLCLSHSAKHPLLWLAIRNVCHTHNKPHGVQESDPTSWLVLLFHQYWNWFFLLTRHKHTCVHSSSEVSAVRCTAGRKLSLALICSWDLSCPDTRR